MSQGTTKKTRSKKSDKLNAIWTDVEQATIVKFLHNRRAEGGEGGTFKKATMNTLVLHLAASHGPPIIAKDLNQVEGKWKTVSHTLSMIANINSLTRCLCS